MCSVVGCESWRRRAQRFKLPADPERRLEWVQFLLEVNGQRLKESSWTDITMCSEHFTDDCFERVSQSGALQLKSSAVPSLCVKSEPEEPEPCQPVKTPGNASRCTLGTHDSPSSCSEESGLTSTGACESPVPSDTSDAFLSDYSQMVQRIVNIDIIREKAALLQMKGKYVVNESCLLQLFRHKCPSCGFKLQMEKVTYGVLIVLKQKCLQCEYRYQWKSQVSARVPAAKDQHLTGCTGLSPETRQPVSTGDKCSSTTGVSKIVDIIKEEIGSQDETEESGDEGNMDSDEDWNNGIHSDDSDEESDDESDDYSPLAPKHSQLCAECGMFFNKRRPHICEHKLRPYSCNICGKRCVSEVALNSHSRVHNENYEHRCKFCHIAFKTKADKHTHEQTHITEGKPYRCPDCSETFATNKERRIHLEDHRGPRQLKCNICGIEFNRPRSLQRHLAVHTGVKPHKCSVCQRGFNQASHLKSHMRLHTGERPYKCQHCDKCFNHNVSLKCHVQREHSSTSGHEQTMYNDNVEEKARRVQKERTNIPKSKKRTTGRPIGRPKRNTAGIQSQCSNTKTAKVKEGKLKKTRGAESKDDQSDTSSASAEEKEERREKVTRTLRRSKGNTKKSDSDFDFDPEDLKRKRYSHQNTELRPAPGNTKTESNSGKHLKIHRVKKVSKLSIY